MRESSYTKHTRSYGGVSRVSNKLKGLLIVLMPLLILVGCSDEEEQQNLTIQNFELVDTYEYDKVKVVVEDEKTSEELAYDVLMETMGLTTNENEGYKEVGISENNGVFINAGILEGNQIPKVSGYSVSDIAQVNSGQEQSESVKLEHFQELQKNREYKVSVYDEDEVLKETTDRIKQAAMEQQLRRDEQLQKQEQQEIEGGTPEFTIESVDPDGNIDNQEINTEEEKQEEEEVNDNF